jgi:hypothetical protein
MSNTAERLESFIKLFGLEPLQPHQQLWDSFCEEEDLVIVSPEIPHLTAIHFAKIYRTRLRCSITEDMVEYRGRIISFCERLEASPDDLVSHWIFQGELGGLTLWFFVESLEVIMVDARVR